MNCCFNSGLNPYPLSFFTMMHNVFDSMPSCAMAVQQNKDNLGVNRVCRDCLNNKSNLFLSTAHFYKVSLNFSVCHHCWQCLSILTFTILFNILKASIISLLFNVFSSSIVISVFLALRCNITSFPIYHSGPVNPFCPLSVFPATLFLSLLREIVSNGKSLSVFNQPPLQCLAS